MAAKIIIILTDSESLFSRPIQFRTTILTICSLLLMPDLMAMRTFQLASFTLFPDHCGRYNPCRDGYNRITYQHHDRRQETSDRCHRRYVSITDRCHRHDGPIDTVRNIIKLRAGLVSFYHIHDRTDRNHQYQDKKEKHEYLRSTDPERLQ